jgi:hypothetical protein
MLSSNGSTDLYITLETYAVISGQGVGNHHLVDAAEPFCKTSMHEIEKKCWKYNHSVKGLQTTATLLRLDHLFRKHGALGTQQNRERDDLIVVAC